MEIRSSTSVSVLPILACKKMGQNYLAHPGHQKETNAVAPALPTAGRNLISHRQPNRKEEAIEKKKSFYKFIYKYIICILEIYKAYIIYFYHIIFI